jgi:hypothetical protein
VGRLQDIENVINSTISHYSHVKVFPRGLPLFIDSLLRGVIRFGRRTGNSISVINPDNTYFFKTPPKIRDQSITLTRNPLPEWVSTDVIVSLGPRKELNVIDDIVDSTLLLKIPLQKNYTDQDQLLLYAFPLLVSFPAASGSTTLQVKSKYKLANGEIFAYLQDARLLQSLTEIRVTSAVFLGTTPDPFFTNLYSITLEQPIDKDVETNEVVYHRMFPAYFSAAIRVPNALLTSDPIGPFLLDILSGRLLEGKTFRETLALRTLDRSGNYISGNSGTYLTIDKNHVIIDRPFSAHFPMFWEVAEGSMRLTPSRCIFKTNQQSQFVVGLRCIPPIPPNKSWRISVKSNEDCTLRFIFKPHAMQEFFLPSAINQNLLVTIPAGEDVTQIEINVLGLSSVCEVSISDWTPAQSSVEQIEYSFIVEADGDATYQSTGMLLKPYFIGSEFLKTYWDSNATTFDGGKVYF